MPAETLSPRRRQLLDAAVTVVATEGLRGLTHRAVDRQAGLPEGTCSAYLRTRKALVTALGEYVTDRGLAHVELMAEALQDCPEDDLDRAEEVVTEFFMELLQDRDVLLARIELSLAALRDPDLATVLQTARGRLVALVEQILARRSKEHSREMAEVLVASVDGVLMGALPKPEGERRPFLRRSLEALLGGLG